MATKNRKATEQPDEQQANLARNTESAIDTNAKALYEKTSIGELLRNSKTLPKIVFAIKQNNNSPGLFIKAISQHRFWKREVIVKVRA